MDKPIKTIKILPGCILCGNCEIICPEVFEVNKQAHIKEGIDVSRYIDCINEAIDMCPVGVIKADAS